MRLVLKCCAQNLNPDGARIISACQVCKETYLNFSQHLSSLCPQKLGCLYRERSAISHISISWCGKCYVLSSFVEEPESCHWGRHPFYKLVCSDPQLPQGSLLVFFPSIPISTVILVVFTVSFPSRSAFGFYGQAVKRIILFLQI